MKLINIQTSDGETIEVEWVAARQSQIIQKILDEELIELIEENIIPISNEKVTGPVFKKALVWMENNRGWPDFQEDNDDDMFLRFELFLLVVQFYQLGFSMEFFNSICLLAFLDKNRAAKKSIDPIKLNYK